MPRKKKKNCKNDICSNVIDVDQNPPTEGKLYAKRNLFLYDGTFVAEGQEVKVDEPLRTMYAKNATKFEIK